MKKILKFYFRRKKLCLLFIAAVAFGAVYAWPDIAIAQGGTEDVNSLIKSVNELFNMFLKITSAWLWPVILMTGSLLDNELIFGGEMGERLLSVWVQIRNLVNIVFVVILVAIAVYNVLPGVGEESGGLSLGLKTALPKFVLALIAVNFSFLAAKVVLDFTNVVTGAVFALPRTAIAENDLQKRVHSIICGTDSDEVPMRALWCEQGELNERAQAFFSKLDRSNITLAYALRFGNAVQMKFIRGGLQDIGQLAFNVIFNALLYAVYAISHIVLFLVLLLRIVVLWIGVAFSPLIALGIVLPNLKGLSDGVGQVKEKFIANAIAPIKIGLVLSIGYIMLDGFEVDKTIHGDKLSGVSIDAVDPNALPTGITDLQQLMIAVAVVVIIWVGVFEGTKGTAAESITNWIKGTMEGFGKWVAKLPTYAQIIPVSGKVGEKPVSLQQAWHTLLYRGQKWTRERSEPLKTTADQLDDLKHTTTSSGVAKVLSDSAGLLKDKAGVELLISKAEGLKDRKLADAIKDLGDAAHEQPEELARVIWSRNQDGELAKEIRKAFDDDKEKFVRTINVSADVDRKREEEGPPGTAAAPVAVTNAAAALTIFKDPAKKAEDLAGKGSFEEWTAAQIKEFREAIGPLPESTQLAIIEVKDGKIKYLTPAQITAARTSAVAPAGSATDLTGAAAAPLVPPAVPTGGATDSAGTAAPPAPPAAPARR